LCLYLLLLLLLVLGLLSKIMYLLFTCLSFIFIISQVTCLYIPVFESDGSIKAIEKQQYQGSSFTTRTTTRRSTTKSPSRNDTFTTNLRRTALILAGIALSLALLRLCLMLCKDKTTDRRTRATSVRPQQSRVVSIIDTHHKLDLPPEYHIAVSTSENEQSKLPSYDELERTTKLPDIHDTSVHSNQSARVTTMTTDDITMTRNNVV